MQLNSPLSDFLPYMLSVTSNAISGRIAQEYRSRWGLKVPEWRVMAVLGDAGSVTQRELTDLTLMDKVAVNRACKELQERGLIWRQPNVQDGRSHLLELTDSGRDMYGEIMPLAREMERRLLAKFSMEEISAFKSVLLRLKAEVRDLHADGIDSGTFEA